MKVDLACELRLQVSATERRDPGIVLAVPLGPPESAGPSLRTRFIMKRVLSGVLFDLDGTLIDTAAAERSVWPSLAAIMEEHIPSVERSSLEPRYVATFDTHWTDYLEGRVDFAEYRLARLREALEPWGEVSEDLFDAYYAEKRRTIDVLRPFDDTLETLSHVRQAGLRSGLLTNGPSWMQRRKLEVTELENEFDAVAISEEIGSSKPEPEAFDIALAMIGCKREQVAMVGDSPAYDIDGAQAAGLAVAVLVAPSEATSGGEEIVISRLGQLLPALGLQPERG